MQEDFGEGLDFEKIQAEIKQRQRLIAEREANMLRLTNELMEAERLVIQLRKEKNNSNADKMTLAQEIRHLEKEAAKALRFQRAQDERDRLIKEYNEKAAELDALTANSVWREFAFDHQITGGKRLAVAQRGILGDKRGLGKTLTSLIYLDMAQSKKVLVIAPNDVVPQFEQEIQHWAAHRSIMSFAGLNKGQRSIIYPMLRQLDAFIITINYEAWRRDKTIIDDLVAAGLDTVILDEAHRAKSFDKITAKGIIQVVHSKNWCPNEKKIVPVAPWFNEEVKKLQNVNPLVHVACPDCGEALEPSVKNVLSMTGTPILNKPQELFTMLHLVDPFRFNKEEQFLRDYCYAAAPGKWKFFPGGLDRLTKSMSEFFIQRNRDDAGIKLPPPDIKIHYLDPDPVNYPKQYQAYKDLTTAAALVLDDGTAYNMLYVLEIILRERQIITWPAGVELKIRDEDGEIVDTLKFDVHESQKLDAVCELLEELAEEGERFIVFSQFKAPLYEAQRRLQDKGFNVTTATGDDSTWHRTRVREDFDLKTASKDNYQWVGCFATYKAFATGINLNAARHAIFIDDEWSPGMEDQAIGRIDRLNSEDQANVHIFRVNKTVDTFMEALLKEKQDLSEGFESSISAKDMLSHLRNVL